MSDWASQEEAAEEEKAHNHEFAPSDWEDEQNAVDDDQWKNQTQQDMDREADATNINDTNENGDNTTAAVPADITRTRSTSKVSKHYVLESTEPLRANDAYWILIKSTVLWLYLLCLSVGVFSSDWPSLSPQTIWLVSYLILFIFWCCFFKRTASCSLGGFYPFTGASWKPKVLHCAALLCGLGAIDLYRLERRRCVMRECLMQYKVLECSILSFVYFVSLFVRWQPWGQAIDEHEYAHWSTHWGLPWLELVQLLPVLLLLMDAVTHYAKVYHWQLFWMHFGALSFFLRYSLMLFVLCVDQLVRSLLLLLFVRVASSWLWLVLVAYAALCVGLWLFAMQSMSSLGAAQAGFKLMLRKSGGKLIQAMLYACLSVCGLFEMLPCIKSAAGDIQRQHARQQRWGENVVRCECAVRLLMSVVVFAKYWVMRNWRFEYEQKFAVYALLVAFAVYPYLMELLLQTPLSALCRGSFWVLHHIDNLTSLPNLHRLQKDWRLQKRSKRRNAVVVVNVSAMRALNHKFGARCGDRTLMRVMQRIVFEMEEQERRRRLKLYRGKHDRFVLIAAFEDKEQLEPFVRALVAIQLTVQRPSDYDVDREKKKKEDERDVENVGMGVGMDDAGMMSGAETDVGGLNFEADDDDFINPNKGGKNLYGGGTGGGGDDGGGGGANWFDDDEEDKGDEKNPTADTNKKNGKKKVKMRRRGNSSYNKTTADESLSMCVRVCASFGDFSSLTHAMSLDHELKVDAKNGRIHDIEDRFKIVELKEKFK